MNSGIHYKQIVPVLYNVISSWFLDKACFVIDTLLLWNNGSYFKWSNLYNKQVSTEQIKYHQFHIAYKRFGEKSNYQDMIKKIKKVDIFAYKNQDITNKTMIHKANEYVSQDETIGITMSIFQDKLYVTTFAKIMILEETENKFIFCMNTCNENIVNGYYRIIVKYDPVKKEIDMEYSKMQQFSACPFKYILLANQESYIETNKESVLQTAQYLCNDNRITIDHVKYNNK
jgi:hypothetical protein